MVWQYSGMVVWQYSGMVVWQYGDMLVRECGSHEGGAAICVTNSSSCASSRSGMTGRSESEGGSGI